MRLGKVFLNLEYVVDLDNEEMVKDAKRIVVEDMEQAILHNEAENIVEVKEAPEAKESDIPDFLLELDDVS